MDALTEDLIREKTAQSTAQSELDALNRALADEKTVKSTTEAELTEATDALSKLKAELSALAAELAEEKKSKSDVSASAETEIAKIQEALSEAQSELVKEKELASSTAATAEAELAKSNKALAVVQAEVDDLAQQLALEKMEKATAQADLEAALSKKPDTSEADSLRKELQALKDQHQASLTIAQEELAKTTEEHLATKAALEKAQEEHSRIKAESTSDYKDMHESLTQLVEEANKKAADLEAHLKEAEANLKVKDAELAEAKVYLSLFMFVKHY